MLFYLANSFFFLILLHHYSEFVVPADRVQIQVCQVKYDCQVISTSMTRSTHLPNTNTSTSTEKVYLSCSQMLVQISSTTFLVYVYRVNSHINSKNHRGSSFMKDLIELCVISSSWDSDCQCFVFMSNFLDGI